MCLRLVFTCIYNPFKHYQLIVYNLCTQNYQLSLCIKYEGMAYEQNDQNSFYAKHL